MLYTTRMTEPFGVGTVLGTGFRVWMRNLVPFMLITGVLYIPVILWTLAWIDHDHTRTDVIYFGFEVTGISLVLDSFAAAAITFGVVKELQGQHASIAQCVSTGFSRMVPTLGVVLLSILAMAGGFVMLIIPGIVVVCMLYVATPACVIERPGVIGALRRSRDLTSGFKTHIFGLRLVLYCISWATTQLQKAIFEPHDLASLKVNMYVSLGVEVALGSLGAVMAAVAYYYLRAEKEGTTATELAKVFE
jgi:hypothetical protein